MTLSILEDFYYNIDVPILRLCKRKGMTDYIDFLKWNEVEYPVMKGIDLFGRKFLVIKYSIDGEKQMQTFFQRYTGGYGWMGCGHATNYFIDTSGGITDLQSNLVKKIIEGEEVTILEDHRPCCEFYIGKKVKLFDQKKIDAAEIIQKMWRKCRYDPKYKMCKKVQENNLESIYKEYNKTLL